MSKVHRKKVYRRIVRRRLEAALELRMRPAAPPRARLAPTIAPPRRDTPVEIIDLATGPFERQFPDLGDG